MIDGGAGDEGAMPMPEAPEANEAPETAPAPASTEQCIPVEALAMPDDKEQMATPEPGDLVTYEVQGKVSRVEGGMAYVSPEKVNGQDMPEAAEDPNTEPDEDNQRANGFAALQDEATQMGPMQ